MLGVTIGGIVMKSVCLTILLLSSAFVILTPTN